MSRITFDDFPEVADRERQAEKAAELLARAAAVVTALAPAETHQEHAQRLRGAASYARTAADELLVTVGYMEAASAAENAGLWDREE